MSILKILAFISVVMLTANCRSRTANSAADAPPIRSSMAPQFVCTPADSSASNAQFIVYKGQSGTNTAVLSVSNIAKATPTDLTLWTLDIVPTKEDEFYAKSQTDKGTVYFDVMVAKGKIVGTVSVPNIPPDFLIICIKQ